ncbi:winged helix-turn-helix domain-containing protein [Natrarchaeobius oligotrophus]|uniref:ArsR family transcriptional regulator n=1 Tax=Natrarchaeobius chitinivorans TaxID=1679083 RepID=A0A3N6MVM6_NATCH|nr:winged helix-turn-helix domain-containing protein [Natrarchaeobius chitinivorans]RQH00392.1 ArsR family transcriptional regulator [Natrarchaeobius chitinivorans]
MKLRQPTDFLILEALEDKGRNVATNLAAHTGKSRKNINTRLPVLEDYGLVEKIGPAERSGLYEITSLGKAALVYRDQYDEVDDFESLIEGPRATDANESPEAQMSFVRGEEDEESDDE